MPRLVFVPLVISMASGIASFFILAIILRDLADLDPERLQDLHRFENSIVGKLLKINGRKVRALVKDRNSYGNARFAFLVGTYWKLSVLSGLSMAVAIVVTAGLTLWSFFLAT